jgi:hypothetical protein
VSVPQMARICPPLFTSGGTSSPAADIIIDDAVSAQVCQCWLETNSVVEEILYPVEITTRRWLRLEEGSRPYYSV